MGKKAQAEIEAGFRVAYNNWPFEIQNAYDHGTPKHRLLILAMMLGYNISGTPKELVRRLTRTNPDDFTGTRKMTNHFWHTHKRRKP